MIFLLSCELDSRKIPPSRNRLGGKILYMITEYFNAVGGNYNSLYDTIGDRTIQNISEEVSILVSAGVFCTD